MPLALDPQQTFEVTLDSDKGKSPSPAFRFRYLSGRQWIAVASMADAKDKSTSGPDALRALYDILRIGLIGWSNMTTTNAAAAQEFGITLNGQAVELPYQPENLDVLLGPADANELLLAMMTNVRPGPDVGKA